MKKVINLSEYKELDSSVFAGRYQGELVRQILDLNQFDHSIQVVEFIIPEGTSSFNTSFYIGLLYDSFKKLGVKKFEQKYFFTIQDTNENNIKILKSNLEDGKRHCINLMNINF